jgi:hypothetical protein
MYLQYFVDFYDDLPEISVFIHNHEISWHIEPLLKNTTFMLHHLNLDEIRRREYVNLRVEWGVSCPNWLHPDIRTYDSKRPEQMFMADAFRDLFGEDVPEVFAAPCCSQFAVTRDAIRRIPKQKYQDWIQWILNTRLADANSGRVWEHLWSYVFLKKAVDCPVAWKTYCTLYGMCFDGQQAIDHLAKLSERRSTLQLYVDRIAAGDKMARLASKLRAEIGIVDSSEMALDKAKERLMEINHELESIKSEALIKGRTGPIAWTIEELYID